jgi:hypothetical protein
MTGRAMETKKHSAPYPAAEKARQGRIVLTTPLRKAIFLSGLVAVVVLIAVLAFAASPG